MLCSSLLYYIFFIQYNRSVVSFIWRFLAPNPMRLTFRSKHPK